MDKNTISWSDFIKIDIRIGTIIAAENFEKAKNPAYILKVDFGELGVKKTSAQITALYDESTLIGKQVVCVVNFPPKQIANIMSECLVLGALGKDKDVILLQPEREVPNGLKIA